MARSFNGTTQYGETASAPVTTLPLSIACWVYPTATGASREIISLHGSSGRAFQLWQDSTGKVIAYTRNAGSDSGALTSGAMTQNAWNHIAGVWASTTSRKAYRAGTDIATDTNSIATPTVTALAVAKLFDVQYFVGRVAHLGIWNVALTDDDVLSLSKGFSPLLIRPANLVEYWSLLGNDSPELSPRGLAMPLTASPTKADDPAPIFFPQGRQ